VRAAPMVALTAFSVGVTLAMQAAHSLQQLGAEIYVPDLVMVTLLRSRCARSRLPRSGLAPSRAGA